MPMLTRTLPTDGIDFRRTLQAICFLHGDPTCRVKHGLFERATLTPDGPGSIRATWNSESVQIETWGSGAEWLIESAPRLFGVKDDVSGFDPQQRAIRRLYSQNPGLRIGATHTVWHDLAWLIVQQRVSTKAAGDHWRAMVWRWGEPAPGPVELRLPPDPKLVASKGYADFHPFGIERQRAENLRAAGREAHRLQDIVEMTFADANHRLQFVRGIGPWTAGYAQATTLGDADAIVPGDYGLPSRVSWVLAGERRGDDARMIELLEPFAGHRWRVCRLMMAAGVEPPRRAPRRGTPDIRRW